jgi:hypothetical protein
MVAATSKASPKTGQLPWEPLWEECTPLFNIDSRDPSPAELDLARRVIASVQSAYRENEPGPLPLGDADAWATCHRLAVAVITRRHGGNNRPAKQIQLEVSAGRPLAACVGRLELGRARYYDGSDQIVAFRHCCGAVFEDSRRLNAHVWSRLCPKCRGNRTTRLRAEHAAARRRHAMLSRSSTSS